MSSKSQINRKNDKKRTREFRKNLELHIKEGKRIVLKKPANPDMMLAAKQFGIDADDFCADTLSPAERERRREAANTYQREVYKKDAIATNGKYNPTGKQDKKLSETEQSKKEYFEMDDAEQIAAQEKYQLVRDVQRGWRCPMCKQMVPDLINLSQMECEEYVEVPIKSKSGDTTYQFVFHKACHDKYIAHELKRKVVVHSVNTPDKMLARFIAWGKDGNKEPIVINEESIYSNDDKVIDKSD